MSEELKPCPFCGGIASEFKDDWGFKKAHCPNPECNGHTVTGTPHEWNRRADFARIAALEKELAEAKWHKARMLEENATLAGECIALSKEKDSIRQQLAEAKIELDVSLKGRDILTQRLTRWRECATGLAYTAHHGKDCRMNKCVCGLDETTSAFDRLNKEDAS